MSEAQVVVCGPGEGEAMQGPVGGPLSFKVRGSQSGGRLTALENEVAPGEGPPLHTHEAEDESWYVLEGRLRFRIADDEALAPAGSFVFVPRGVAHCFVNPDDVPARVLVLFTPSGMERFFERFASTSAPAPEAFRKIGGEVGMEVVGPPLRDE